VTGLEIAGAVVVGLPGSGVGGLHLRKVHRCKKRAMLKRHIAELERELFPPVQDFLNDPRWRAVAAAETYEMERQAVVKQEVARSDLPGHPSSSDPNAIIVVHDPAEAQRWFP
jgi:hypothetical protein